VDLEGMIDAAGAGSVKSAGSAVSASCRADSEWSGFTLHEGLQGEFQFCYSSRILLG
jgi:hypothetical protein